MSAAAEDRIAVGLAVADIGQFDALVEWVQAAGFAPVAIAPGHEPVAAVLVRWPSTIDLATLGAPIVLLVDPHEDLPEQVRVRAAQVVEQPDPQEVQSLLAWSKHLHEVLQRVTAAWRPVAALQPVELGRDELARGMPDLIAVGVSTGGPEALKVLFATVRGHTLPPMVVVQHMPASFLAPLADRLYQHSGYRVVVATHGEVLAPGAAYLAPGDRHLQVIRRENGSLVAHLCDDPPVRGHRPAAEVLFESCCALPVRGVGVLMTGMGQDGAKGLLALRRQGWSTLGQNAATCAIYGMPMAAMALGAVEHEVPLADIGRWLVMLCRPRSAATT